MVVVTLLLLDLVSNLLDLFLNRVDSVTHLCCLRCDGLNVCRLEVCLGGLLGDVVLGRGEEGA